MLSEIMREIDNSRGSLTVRELSRRLDVEESAIEGMLEFLQRKGRINLQRAGDEGQCAGDCAGCSFLGGCFSGEQARERS